MSLLRAAARPMLASYFIVSGFKAVKNPEPLVDGAAPVADRLVPLVKRVAPDSVSGSIPEDTATLVRINGALQLGGGLALATGKGRRLGAVLLAASLIPSTVSRHPFWTRDTPEAKAEDRAHFLKNVSLLGGVLLASADTEGKPSLAWRAQAGGDKLAKKGRKADEASALSGNSDSLPDSVGKGGKELGEHTQELAGAAVAGGAGLLSTVEKQTRSRRKRPRSRPRRRRRSSRRGQGAGQGRAGAAEKQAKKAAKEAPKLAKQAKKAAKQAEQGEVAARAGQRRRRSWPVRQEDAKSEAEEAKSRTPRAPPKTAKSTRRDCRQGRRRSVASIQRQGRGRRTPKTTLAGDREVA